MWIQKFLVKVNLCAPIINSHFWFLHFSVTHIIYPYGTSQRSVVETSLPVLTMYEILRGILKYEYP